MIDFSEFSKNDGLCKRSFAKSTLAHTLILSGGYVFKEKFDPNIGTVLFSLTQSALVFAGANALLSNSAWNEREQTRVAECVMSGSIIGQLLAFGPIF